MRPQKPMSAADVKKIEETLKKATSVLEYRHAQVLYLRGFYRKTTKEIAMLTRYSRQRVTAIISEYFKHGLAALAAIGNSHQRLLKKLRRDHRYCSKVSGSASTKTASYVSR
jgi:hypothetical protein